MGEHFRDYPPGIKIMLKKLDAKDFIEEWNIYCIIIIIYIIFINAIS